jgi:cytochrome c oxidase cbb3-type subunit I
MLPPIADHLPAKNCALLHAIAWAIFGLVVGSFLSLLQVTPQTQTFIDPITYGRIIPVHLNSMLYGWTGLLCLHFVRGVFDVHSKTQIAFDLLVRVWSFVLALCLGHILCGHSSGKIFLEFEGWSRVLLILLMLWMSLTFIYSTHFLKYEVEYSLWMKRGLRLFAYGSLLVPMALIFATSPKTYPPINPDTGGPTGFDLMGSTVLVMPFLLFLPRYLVQHTTRRLRESMPSADTLYTEDSSIPKPLRFSRIEKIFWALWLGHLVYFIVFSHGAASHHEVREILSMFSLWLWMGVLIYLYDQFKWGDALKIWANFLLCWYCFLTITATVMFLPGILDDIKFTSNLVAHAHLAMAGMCSGVMLLYAFIQKPLPKKSSHQMALLWNGGVGLLVASFLSRNSAHSYLFINKAAVALPLRAGAFFCMMMFFIKAYRHFSEALHPPVDSHFKHGLLNEL